MKRRSEVLEELIWEIRRAFRELAAAAERELHPLRIQTRDRAFLEFLARERAPISISDLARKRSVSRQHIHQTLRRLADSAWVEEIPDRQDRRAVLLRLSPAGQAFWAEVRRVDQAFLERLARRVPTASVATATTLLRSLRRELRQDQRDLQ